MTDSEPVRAPALAVGGQPLGPSEGGVNLVIEANQPSETAAQTVTPGENLTAGRVGQEAGQNGQETGKKDGKENAVGSDEAYRKITKQAETGMQSAQSDKPDAVRKALEIIANPDSTNEDLAIMEEAETRYLDSFDPKKRDGLRERYQDRRILAVTDEAAAFSVTAILNKRNKGEALTGWEIATLLANRENP